MRMSLSSGTGVWRWQHRFRCFAWQYFRRFTTLEKSRDGGIACGEKILSCLYASEVHNRNLIRPSGMVRFVEDGMTARQGRSFDLGSSEEQLLRSILLKRLNTEYARRWYSGESGRSSTMIRAWENKWQSEHKLFAACSRPEPKFLMKSPSFKFSWSAATSRSKISWKLIPLHSSQSWLDPVLMACLLCSWRTDKPLVQTSFFESPIWLGCLDDRATCSVKWSWLCKPWSSVNVRNGNLRGWWHVALSPRQRLHFLCLCVFGRLYCTCWKRWDFRDIRRTLLRFMILASSETSALENSTFIFLLLFGNG
jgi:hypothetical protein